MTDIEILTANYVDKIAELEKENANFKSQLAISEHDREHNDYELSVTYKTIEELKAQIEKMKCCENCKHHSFWGSELKCNLLDYNTEIECLKSKSKWELAE